MRDLLLGKTDLANDGAGVADSEDGDGVALAASAFGAAGAMANGALEQGAAEDLGSVGEASEEAVAALDDPLLIHH